MLVDLATPTETAKDIVKNIARIENNHQNGMEVLYNRMPDTFFKAMRRILPSIYIKKNKYIILVSGVKFNWNGQVHKVT